MIEINRTYLYVWILSVSYFCLLILPYIIFGFSYIPFIISIPDLINLILYTPIITVILILLFQDLSKSHSNIIIEHIFVFLLVLHFLGVGFHWAANAIHETLKHANVSGDAISYAYYLDEIIGHKIMYYPFFLILVLFLFLELKHYRASQEINYLYVILNILSGVLFGFSLIISGIEGQSAYETILMAIIILIIILLSSTSHKKEIGKLPFSSFIFVTSVSVLILGALYFYIFGGFIEPSQIFKS